MRDIEDLIYDMKVVSGARFAMSTRLYFSANAKGFLVNGVTAISIFISAGLLVTNDGKFPVDAVATALIGISIFIMWMNLDKSEYELRASGDQAKRCAIEINDIIKRAQHEELNKDESLNAYQDVINSFDLNHGHYDRAHAIFLLRNKFTKAKGLWWINSTLPWAFQCLWYPFLFVFWAATTIMLAFVIV